MTSKKKYLIAGGSVCLLLLTPFIYIWATHKEKIWSDHPGNKTVSVVKENGRFRLYRNGQPYFIKGVNVLDSRYLADAKKAGANSIRIYNTDNAQALLDSAQQLGLTVMLGVRMDYADKDMDYTDSRAVAAQLEKIRKQVIKFRDHPALLMWGVGNETNLFFDDRPARILSRIAICKAINNVSKMIHETDPNHPTVIPVTGSSSNRVNAIFCDEVDLIGYNSFESFGDQLKKSYWSGPYIVSEFGAKGYWVNKNTEWYNFPEPTSLQKIDFMRQQYAAFSADTVNCLGSYAFMWGYKKEYTSTWFSLYTDRGEQTIMAAALNDLWNGTKNTTGTAISSLSINHKADSSNIYLKALQSLTVSFNLTDTLSNNNMLYWEIQPDNVHYLETSYKSQPKKEVMDSGQQPVAACYKNIVQGQGSFTAHAPAKAGPYRLFLYLKNQQEKTATANACFYVYE